MTTEYTDLVIPVPQIGDAKLEVPDGAVVVGVLRKSDGGRWVIWRDKDANLMLSASDIEDWAPVWIPPEGIHASIDCTKAEKMFILALRQEYPVECPGCAITITPDCAHAEDCEWEAEGQ